VPAIQPVVVHNYCRNARDFLSYLSERSIALEAVTPTQVSQYLRCAVRHFRERRGRPPASSWTSIPRAGIHAVLRFEHRFWPPEPDAIDPGCGHRRRRARIEDCSGPSGRPLRRAGEPLSPITPVSNDPGLPLSLTRGAWLRLRRRMPVKQALERGASGFQIRLRQPCGPDFTAFDIPANISRQCHRRVLNRCRTLPH
jgi:hypothetical protein